MATTLGKLKHAHASALAANAMLLINWRANLTPERRTELAEFERKGLRIGLQLLIPKDSWVFSVVLLDSRGAIQVLETIEQHVAGASPAIN